MFEVGDKVTSEFHGDGEVVSNDVRGIYPIRVRFWGGCYETFTREGKAYITSTSEEYNIKLIEEKDMNPMPELKTGMRVEYADGRIGIVILGVCTTHTIENVIMYNDSEFGSFNRISTELGKIQKVYSISDSVGHLLSFDIYGAQIWDRQEVSPEQQKIKELEETIKQASKQIEELKKVTK